MTEFKETNMDFEIRSMDSICVNESRREHKWYGAIVYMLFGIFFGIVLVKSEAVSWFRIQEMFRLGSFHMYGLIGSAVLTGIVSVWLIRKCGIRSADGEEIRIQKRSFNRGQIIGGFIFGLGWAVTGACPGPLFALIGSGATTILLALLSAVAGTWVYGRWRERLPH
ncbi:MAG: YeeE/YedE family protein [Crocinitomicaceae bacterium]|nr:YeeE/YedE family protein [Crocinitomicaceae bacterium]